MEKDKFLFLLTNSASLNEEETSELIALQDQFPFSQAIHNLAARGSQLNALPLQKTLLNKAAVYATDRAVLKALITTPGVPGKVRPFEPLPPVQEPTPPVVERVEITEKKQPASPIQTKPESREPKIASVANPKSRFEPSKLSGDDLLTELVEDLKRLKKLKHDFEVTIEQFDPGARPSSSKVADTEKVKVKKPSKPIEGIIGEIKNTKKKIKPSDPKQKEQLEIIDKFIKSKPSIVKNKPATGNANTPDLAENSSVFSDNIVSETLVEILIKQGKKEKAVEVLRKLIWKFPQKKAYFAAQIDELTS